MNISASALIYIQCAVEKRKTVNFRTQEILSARGISYISHAVSYLAVGILRCAIAKDDLVQQLRLR